MKKHDPWWIIIPLALELVVLIAAMVLPDEE